MHSSQLEKTGSMRRRTLSRGMSEDESLRHIIREAEETSRHQSRSDSRYGTLKRGQREESQSEDDLSENVEMTELRLNYEECVQELRTLSFQQDALLFQVDCLQDALEGTEEMLAEAQRETHQLSLELERERAMRRKLEDMIASMQETERLREERAAAALESGSAGSVCLQAALEGSSVDRDEAPLPDSGAAPVLPRADPALHRKKMKQTLGLAVCDEAQAGDDNDESSGYEDAPSEFSPCPSTPDADEDGPDGMKPDEPRTRTNSDSCALS